MPSSRAEGVRCPSLRIGTHDSRDRGGIGVRVPVPEMVQHLCEGRNGVARDFIIVAEQGAVGGQLACCADSALLGTREELHRARAPLFPQCASSADHTYALPSLIRTAYAVSRM